MDIKVDGAKKIRGTVTPPPDKSITHRAVFFSSISSGESTIYSPLYSDDTKRTMNLIESLGCKIEKGDKNLIVNPPLKFSEPFSPINCGNSGTTTRIGMGLLARERFFSVLYGDESLSRRPMKRITDPLTLLGAKFDGRKGGSNLPISVRGGQLHAAKYSSPISSAQVKSSFIIAALNAEGDSYYVEPFRSRDHTERFLSQFGLIETVDKNIKIHPGSIPPFKLKIVGDFSSASFFIVLGVIHPNSHLEIENVGLNPTRTGLLNVLKKMGAKMEIVNRTNDTEPYGRVVVESSNLKGTKISIDEIPAMIDEVPLVALLGAFASGETVVHGASELRKKETDRVKATVHILSKMGGKIEELEDGFRVYGGTPLHSTRVNPFGDHRMAMLASIVGTCVDGVEIEDADCVSISYPSFFSDLKEVMKQ